jgi:tRNA G10  N-methylase Trm11
MKTFGEVMRLGMAIKRAMQDSGLSIRLVLPEENATSLASVVVTKNLLLQKGAEICILAGPDKVYTARTLIVQDFEDYGRRDYQRPVRDDKQGMIPPKVAQIMLNLSGAKYNDALLDPFCGVGTMLQEGVLLGFKMLGSDINPTAVSGSEKNLEWFRNRYKIAKGKYHVETSDARGVSELVQTMVTINAIKGVQGIVTEGYLGPIYGKYPKQEEIQKNFKELASLYDASTQEFLKFLPQGGRIIMCLPAYKKNSQEYEMFPNLDFITKNGYNTIDLLDPQVAAALPFVKLTARKTAIYDRKDQIVAREIVIFEKQ